MLSCVLPEDLLVEILADRFMLTDCQRGLVFDSVDTLFAQNQVTACRSLLKALNNRKHMYMVSLKQDFFVLKEREKEDEESKGKQTLLFSKRTPSLFVVSVTEVLVFFVAQNWRRLRRRKPSDSVWKICLKMSMTHLMTSPKPRSTASASKSRKNASKSNQSIAHSSIT